MLAFASPTLGWTNLEFEDLPDDDPAEVGFRPPTPFEAFGFERVEQTCGECGSYERGEGQMGSCAYRHFRVASDAPCCESFIDQAVA